MDRRKFIKRSAAAGAATIIAPYILPSGRLFARDGVAKTNHVVFVMFGGGVRQQEAVLQRYLDDSQGFNIPGNIMYNMFDGTPPDDKIVYGNDGTLPGDTPIPRVLSSTLQQQGVLFKEVECQTAGHYNGFASLVQGNTLLTQGLRQKPINPTVFEYLRRHKNTPASKVWFIGDSIDNSIPLLNHSIHPEYGTKYGANFFAPTTTFRNPGLNSFGNAKNWHPEEDMPHIYKMKYFLDDYYQNVGGHLDEIGNTEEEKYAIKQFMKRMYQQGKAKDVYSSTVEVMREFKPVLTVLNLTGVDVCHGNFTNYLKAMHFADNMVGRLWNEIQSIPDMAGNTTLLITPEHGRNLDPNPIRDQNDWFGYDHSDKNSRRVFSLLAGKGVPSNLTIGDESNPMGLAVDSVPTIADLLGFKDDVLYNGLINGNAQSLLDRI